MASWLVRSFGASGPGSSPDRGTLRCWARHVTLAVSLSTQEIPANCRLLEQFAYQRASLRLSLSFEKNVI